MKRTVTATLEITVSNGARLAVQVAAADPVGHQADERIDITLDGEPIEWRELAAPHGDHRH